jgi:hypothetical protein
MPKTTFFLEIEESCFMCLVKYQMKRKSLQYNCSKMWHYGITFYVNLYIILVVAGCEEKAPPETTTSYSVKLQVNLDLFDFNPMVDTLHFELNENAFNAIKSFNVFSVDKTEYISFYDEQSQSILIYNFTNQQFVKDIGLKNVLKGIQLYKTTAFVKNFDTILISNKNKLYLTDSDGNIKNTIEYVKKPAFAWAVFKNSIPPVFKNKQVFVSIRPYVEETSYKALKSWRLIYGFDLVENKATLYYHYPKILSENLFGHRFLDYSYCYNDDGNFVFSFPPDTLIYETNLESLNLLHYGKSKFQKEDIKPLTKDDLNNDKGYENYMLRDSYGAIYFDPRSKRYLRVLYRKLNKQDYAAKRRQKEQSILIFDEQFRILGETTVDNDILLNNMVVSQSGDLFARILPNDEYALHFIRLAMTEKNQKLHVSKK